VALGDSESVREGEKVYVMGNPRAERNVLSEGILIGAKELGNYRRMLQMTAPFSEGMSGGPVFNKNGEVIGIATFVLREARSSQSSQSLNFAVPINIVKDAVTARKVIDFKDIRTEDSTQTAGHWFILGNTLSKSGKYEGAADAYRKALEIDPGLAGALNGLGVAYTRLTRYREAIGAFRQALRLEPESAWIHSNLGLAFMESGMDREAVDAFNQAIRIMPELGAAHFNLGLTYRRMGMYKEAEESYRNAVRANPQSAEAHFHLGVMYINLKKRDDALEEYRILRDLDPTLAERLSNMMKR
jgi:tetratricopeptide (TPR) repeat protein